MSDKKWIKDTDKHCEYDETNGICLIEKAIAEEAKKPAHLRERSFMISCPCKRCNPYTL